MARIEWVTPRYTTVAGIAHPGEFSNDDEVNGVACLVITGMDDDGLCIEGRPEQLIEFAKRVLAEAEKIQTETYANPELRSLYGIITERPERTAESRAQSGEW